MATFTAMPALLRAQLAAGTDQSEDLITSPTVLLVDAGHDFDASAGAEYVADLPSGDEVAPTGYVRRVLTFTGSVTIDSNGHAVISWTDTSFGNLGGAADATIGGAYVFDDTGDDATARLLYAVPFEATDTTDGTVYTIRWSNPTVRVTP
jgi:hypothetical protein